METALFQQLPETEFYGDFPGEINGFWNDTRTIQPGDCFLALTAQRDGHDFLVHAQQNGASCAIVNRINKNLTLPQLRVPDVFEAAKILVKIHQKNILLPPSPTIAINLHYQVFLTLKVFIAFLFLLFYILTSRHYGNCALPTTAKNGILWRFS